MWPIQKLNDYGAARLDILVIEDSEDDFVLTRELLKAGQQSSNFHAMEFELHWARSLEEGMTLLSLRSFDLVLLDLILHDVEGLDGLRRVHHSVPNVPIVVLTGLYDDNLSVLALHNGAQDFLIKGQLDEATLIRSIRYSIERATVIRELEEARRRAERASRFKSEFLANMSHEIRSPLTPILGYVESMRDPSLSKAERELAIETVVRSCNHLLKVVSDVLDLSKIEAGKLEPEISSASLFEIMDEVEELMARRAAEKKISLGLEYEFPLPSTILTDATRLSQVLINLVGNAIKFTSEGAVKITVSCRPAQEMLRVEIADTGIGLTPKEQERIFEPFSQAQSSIQRCYGGTGLGLAISKELVERLGGSIKVSSTPGKGSVFTLTVSTGPIVKTDMIDKRPIHAALARTAFSAPLLLEGRVLLAEDSPDNQRLICYLLRKVGLEVEVVGDGESAVNRGLHDDFDLVLMDMQMPVMDGYSAAANLRSRGAVLPIVALTAHAVRHKVTRCFEVGCTDHLAKPFSQEQFYGMLMKFLPQKEEGAVPIVPALEETNSEYLRIVLDFIERLPEAVAKVDTAFETRDWPQVEAMAHRLKGASLFGLPEVTSVVERLEVAAEARSETEVIEKLDQLHHLCDRVMAGRDQVQSLLGD